MSSQPFRSNICEVVALVLFLIVWSAAAAIPWVLHITVGWWAGLASIPVLFYIYDTLFVPRGSICMGIPFIVPMNSAILLVAYDGILFLKWIWSLAANAIA